MNPSRPRNVRPQSHQVRRLAASGRPLAGRFVPERPLSAIFEHPQELFDTPRMQGQPAGPTGPWGPELPHPVRARLEGAGPLTLLQLDRPLWPPPFAPHTPDGFEPIAVDRQFRVEGDKNPETLIITGPEVRVQSNAKRRRWSMTLTEDLQSVGSMPLWCCMEFKRHDDESFLVYHARVETELNTLRRFNRDIAIKDVLRTKDDVLLARMTNLPEEASHMLMELAELDTSVFSGAPKEDSLFVSGITSLFADVAHKLYVDYHLPGFVHGDVKLPNIMLTERGEPSIIDNGETQAVNQHGVIRPQFSTYWPPEAAKSGLFGVSGDVFALGQSLFVAMSYLDAHRTDVPGAQGPARATEVQMRTALVIAAMQRPNSSFYDWRNTLITGASGSNSAPEARGDFQMYDNATELFRTLVPQLFSHWLVRLVAQEPRERASLDESASLLAELFKKQSEKSKKAFFEHRSEILEMNKSNEIRPLLDDASFHFARRI